jgi:hypothetical protein
LSRATGHDLLAVASSGVTRTGWSRSISFMIISSLYLIRSGLCLLVLAQPRLDLATPEHQAPA